MNKIKCICEDNAIPIKDTSKLHKSKFPFKLTFRQSGADEINRYVGQNISICEIEYTSRYFIVYCSLENEAVDLISSFKSHLSRVACSKEQTRNYWFTDEGWFFGRASTPVIGPCATFEEMVERVGKFNPKPITIRTTSAEILPFKTKGEHADA